MWIARDEDQSLWLFEFKPFRKNHVWHSTDSDFMKLSDFTLFPNLKWEDEPIEVEITRIFDKAKEPSVE